MVALIRALQKERVCQPGDLHGGFEVQLIDPPKHAWLGTSTVRFCCDGTY